ncbi:hypothetical protein BDV98DRAFT_314973 [Pterulicium gracile]|uniref:Uncharacterized protein n=1 Tax=Pterulicium gracile TaxID=1884261 RepID=A0A5C3QS50_9AGAR|nr:hypothetical protein BDV98DRAFT_314973 [Pterula gracilis]
MVVGWVITLYEGLMNALSGAADEEARGEYVNEHVTAMRADHPEFNVIMAHTGHEGRFEEPCYHAHVEFDRPFPIPGTIGYEIYLARRGNFTLTGDGGFQNVSCFVLSPDLLLIDMSFSCSGRTADTSQRKFCLHLIN